MRTAWPKTPTSWFCGDRVSASAPRRCNGTCVVPHVWHRRPVDYIIAVALPALMFIYPLTISLILLNALPGSWTPRGGPHRALRARVPCLECNLTRCAHHLCMRTLDPAWVESVAHEMLDTARQVRGS